MAVFEKDFYIKYSDIDEKNQLKLTSLLDFLQEIGGLHTSNEGFGLYDIPKTNFAWIVLNWNIRIYKLPKCYDKIHVVTWPSKTEEFFAYRDYEIYNENNELICNAISKWVTFDVLNQRIEKVPENVNKILPPENRHTFECKFSKLKEPDNFKSVFDYTVLKYDIDTNSHLNNVHYLRLGYEALPHNISDLNFSNVEIMYKKSCKLGEKISCLYSRINEVEHVVSIKSADLKELHAIVKFKQ